MPSKPVPLDDSHTTKFSCQQEAQPWPPVCADFVETRPRRFHLTDTGLFITISNFSAPAAKQSFYFSGSGLLLTTANSSAPANQKHRFLIQNIKLAPVESV